jgi:quercetin 2,3-dioxygenase
MSAIVRQTVPLTMPWPTVDPFLFCVHHLDAYPVGNDHHGPAVALTGRQLGQDFAGLDGWRMYHGERVPGFPQHPHRGFETITFVRRGLIDHADSLGAAARYGRGDVQWLTAGAGIVHSEMFPLLDHAGPNPVELFQIWLNLPSADKMADPYFTMLWDGDIPRLRSVDPDGRQVEVTVIAGALAGLVPPSPPPSSWAARPDADVAVWHVHMEAATCWTLPAAAGPDTVRMLYVFSDSPVRIGDEEIAPSTGALVRCDAAVELTAPGEVECLVLQGRPIGEPVAQYGPFVMNDRDGIERAFADYRRTQFGGWPWSTDEPVHGDEPRRFARRPDGTVEEPTTIPVEVPSTA